MFKHKKEVPGIGVGGLQCFCCNPFGARKGSCRSGKKGKQKANRYLRRYNKQKLR